MLNILKNQFSLAALTVHHWLLHIIKFHRIPVRWTTFSCVGSQFYCRSLTLTASGDLWHDVICYRVIRKWSALAFVHSFFVVARKGQNVLYAGSHTWVYLLCVANYIWLASGSESRCNHVTVEDGCFSG